jgi:hypothetical protein
VFKLFQKKSQVEILIDKDGIDLVTDHFAEVVAGKLTSGEIAYQFTLEEVERASMGDSISKRFASNSGIKPEQYWSALHNAMPEVDGPDGPQQLLHGLSLQLAKNQQLMTKFRCSVNDKIMKKFGLGRYQSWSD